MIRLQSYNAILDDFPIYTVQSLPSHYTPKVDNSSSLTNSYPLHCQVEAATRNLHHPLVQVAVQAQKQDKVQP